MEGGCDGQVQGPYFRGRYGGNDRPGAETLAEGPFGDGLGGGGLSRRLLQMRGIRVIICAPRLPMPARLGGRIGGGVLSLLLGRKPPIPIGAFRQRQGVVKPSAYRPQIEVGTKTRTQ